MLSRSVNVIVAVTSVNLLVMLTDMVKNKGFLPSGPSEISVQRKQIKSIVYSLLNACIEKDQDSGVAFRPQAIIANPPAYGKYFCIAI